jgi:mRNA-degrading endonuclease toxin of MazEF toxin-antitoxin module
LVGLRCLSRTPPRAEVRRGEIWECHDGRAVLVVQHPRLNAELPTVIGLVVTDVAQRAPEPIRVALTAEETTIGRPMWVKIPLVLTLDRRALQVLLAVVDPRRMAAVDAALARVLGLQQS